MIAATFCLPFAVALVLAQTSEADKQASNAIAPRRQPSVHTYSIVALGVAVQSNWFSVGGLATWAEAGVGAVSTQSIIAPGFGALFG